jgi:hypothetical protein
MRGTLARTQIVTLFLSKLLGAKRCFLDPLFKHLLALYLLSGSTPVELFPLLLWTDLIPIWLGGF